MCEYCNPDYEFRKRIRYDTVSEAVLNRNDQLHVKVANIGITLTINNCPMCGRELRGEGDTE